MRISDRLGRAGRRPDAPEGRASSQAPPPSSGPDEETVRIARKDFRKRRLAGRWHRVRTLVLATLALAVLAGAGWVVYFSGFLTAEDVEVTGSRTIGDARVERAAEVERDRPLARVDLDAIRARVESIPSVRRVEVSRGWPHTVRISVTERTPVAVIDQGQGEGLRAMDSEGVLFRGYENRPARLPLVRTEPDLPDEALVEAARVINALPDRVAGSVDRVEVASVDDIQLVLANGRRVVWGSADQSGQKAEVLAVLLKRPASQIDVSVPGRPTTR